MERYQTILFINPYPTAIPILSLKDNSFDNFNLKEDSFMLDIKIEGNIY